MVSHERSVPVKSRFVVSLHFALFGPAQQKIEKSPSRRARMGGLFATSPPRKPDKSARREYRAWYLTWGISEFIALSDGETNRSSDRPGLRPPLVLRKIIRTFNTVRHEGATLVQESGPGAQALSPRTGYRNLTQNGDWAAG